MPTPRKARVASSKEALIDTLAVSICVWAWAWIFAGAAMEWGAQWLLAAVCNLPVTIVIAVRARQNLALTVLTRRCDCSRQEPARRATPSAVVDRLE